MMMKGQKVNQFGRQNKADFIFKNEWAWNKLPCTPP